MSGQGIISDIKAALREAGSATGSGPLVAQLTPSGIGGNPWSAPLAPIDPVDILVVIDRYSKFEMNGTSILSGDVRVFAEAGVVIPKTGDSIAIEGLHYRIESVDPLSPAGVDLMYECQCRRA